MKYYTVNRPLESGGSVPLFIGGAGVGYSTRGLRSATKFADASSAQAFADWVKKSSRIQLYPGQVNRLEIKTVSDGKEAS